MQILHPIPAPLLPAAAALWRAHFGRRGWPQRVHAGHGLVAVDAAGAVVGVMGLRDAAGGFSDGGPVGEWIDSCTRLRMLARPDQLVLPGHKLPFTGLPFRLDQLIANHHTALERLAQALAQAPRTAVGCFDILFRRRIGEGEFGLALVEAVAHLNHLHRAGVIRPAGETDGAVLWGA